MFNKKIAAALLLFGLGNNQCSAANIGKNFDSQIVKNVGCAVAGVLGGTLGTLLVQKIVGKDEKKDERKKQNPGGPSVKVTDEVVCRCILDYENQKAQWEIFDESLREKIEGAKRAIEYEFELHNNAVAKHLGFVTFRHENNNTIRTNNQITLNYKRFVESLRNVAKSDYPGYNSINGIKRVIFANKGVFEVRKNSDGSYFCWYAVKNLDGQFERRDFKMLGDVPSFLGSLFGHSEVKRYMPDDDYGLENKELNFKITEEYFDKLVGNEKK